MEDDLKKLMNSKSNYELYRILTVSNYDYTNIALKIAKKEFEQRNLSVDEVHKLELISDVEQNKKLNLGNENLEYWQRILYFSRVSYPSYLQ